METFLSFFTILELIVLFSLGCLTFFTTVLDDWLNEKKILRKFAWYLQEFIYTVLSIVIGLSACLAMESSKGVTWLVAIMMGLIGSTLIRKVKLRQEKIADGVIDSVENKIKSTIETTKETMIKTTYEKSVDGQAVEAVIPEDDVYVARDKAGNVITEVSE